MSQHYEGKAAPHGFVWVRDEQAAADEAVREKVALIESVGGQVPHELRAVFDGLPPPRPLAYLQDQGTVQWVDTTYPPVDAPTPATPADPTPQVEPNPELGGGNQDAEVSAEADVFDATEPTKPPPRRTRK